MGWPLTKPDIIALCGLQISLRSTSNTLPIPSSAFNIYPPFQSNWHTTIETLPSGSLSVACMTSQDKLTGNIGSRLFGLNAVIQTSWYPGILKNIASLVCVLSNLIQII